MYRLSVGLSNAIKSPSKFEKRLKSSVILYKILISLGSFFLFTFLRVMLVFILLPITVFFFSFLHCFPKLSRSLEIYTDDFYQFLRCINIYVRLSLLFSYKISKYALPKSRCNLKYILTVESTKHTILSIHILIPINNLLVCSGIHPNPG